MSVQLIALGTGAGKALNHLIRTGGVAASLLAVNTDAQDLKRCLAPAKLQLGGPLVRGLGCGGDADLGRECAAASRDALVEALAEVDEVLLLVGLGGGTGSGASAVVCKVAAELGARVRVVATLPLPLEGRRRRRVAEDALSALNRASNGNVIVAEEPAPGEPQPTMQELFARRDAAVAATVRGMLDQASHSAGPSEAGRPQPAAPGAG